MHANSSNNCSELKQAYRVTSSQHFHNIQNLKIRGFLTKLQGVIRTSRVEAL